LKEHEELIEKTLGKNIFSQEPEDEDEIEVDADMTFELIIYIAFTFYRSKRRNSIDCSISNYYYISSHFSSFFSNSYPSSSSSSKEKTTLSFLPCQEKEETNQFCCLKAVCFS